MDAPRAPRRSASFFIGLVVILAALPVGYFLFLHQPPAPPPTPPPVSPPVVVEAPPPEAPPVKGPEHLTLKEISGTVEVRRGDGQWRTVKAGEALRASDAVRTRDGSYAVLIGGESVEVRMEAGTEVSVEELTDSLSRLLLGNGMTTVRVKPGAQQNLEMRASGSDALARTNDGTFTLSNNGAGTVALATLVGEVSLSGQRKVVIVRSGQQSIIHPGRGPTDPTPIPKSLLLKVKWPTRARRQVVLAGQSEPGSHVVVAGQVVPTDDQGHFSRTLSLEEGRHTVKVHALSVGGLRQEEVHDVSVDTTPPQQITVDPGLWDDPRPQQGQSSQSN